MIFRFERLQAAGNAVVLEKVMECARTPDSKKKAFSSTGVEEGSCNAEMLQLDICPNFVEHLLGSPWDARVGNGALGAIYTVTATQQRGQDDVLPRANGASVHQLPVRAATAGSAKRSLPQQPPGLMCSRHRAR